MHRFRSWTLDPPEWRTQRNRLLPAEGGDGSTLSLDFTTGVLDPRLTFTRGSNATFINSSGFVEWSASNHAPRTNWNFTNPTSSGWNAATLSGTGTFQWVGNGTVIAASGSAGQSFTTISASTGIAEGLRYVMSVTASSVTGSPTIQSIFDFTGASGNTYFKNGAAATAGTTVASGDRISVSAIATAITMNVRLGCGAWFVNRTNESVTLTQFHWHPGSVPVVYYENTGTSPRYDSARFDHDPTTLAPRGLLVEGSDVNYALQSGLNPFASPTWQTAGTTSPTITVGYTGNGFAPDNTSNPTRVQFAVNGGNASRISQQTSYTTNPTTAAPYTVSVWMKSNTAGTNYTINILGTAGSIAFTVTPTWQRFTLVNTSGTSLVGYVYISNESGSVAADVLIWGAQLEAGSGASSYIPTGASQATRVADSCVMTGTNFSSWYNASEGTFIAQFQTQHQGNTPSAAYLLALDSSASKRLIYLNTDLDTASTFDGTLVLSAVGDVTGVLAKVASAYNSSERAIVANGGAVATGSVAVGYSSATSLGIGLLASNSTFKQIKFFPTRLSNSQLQALTTG